MVHGELFYSHFLQFLQIATDLNYFNTSYMGWCDAGFFRYEVERGDFRPSVLHTPEIFDDSKVSLML